MKEAIELLIEDYQRRAESANNLMIVTTDIDQYNRCSGMYQAYGEIVRELKGVLARNDSNNTRDATGNK